MRALAVCTLVALALAPSTALAFCDGQCPTDGLGTVGAAALAAGGAWLAGKFGLFG